MPAQFGGLGLARGPMGGGYLGGNAPRDRLLATSMARWQNQTPAAYGVERLPAYSRNRGFWDVV